MDIEYFQRQIELWGKKVQKRLEEKSVLIIGCGGLGCSVATALSGVGLKKIYLVDFDKVSNSNIHRQIAFHLSDIGRYKSKVLRKSIKNRSKNVKVKAFTEDFNAFRKREINDFDLIIDCTDNLFTRKEIDSYSKTVGIPWIYGSVEAFSGQVCIFEKSSFDVFNIQSHKIKGVAAPYVMKIAATQANLAVMLLARKNPKTDLLYFYSFNSEGEEVVQKFKLPV